VARFIASSRCCVSGTRVSTISSWRPQSQAAYFIEPAEIAPGWRRLPTAAVLRVGLEGMRRGASSDADLLASWSTGSRAAGDELIKRHFDVVHRFFRNKVGAELEDLVQQTLRGCRAPRARYRGDASFKTFLLAIARKQLFRHYGKRRCTALDVEVISVRDLQTSPSGVVARHEDERLLLEALRSVPLEAQVVLELVYWEGLDGNDLARVLDVPVNTAYARVHRAKIALRERMTELAPDRATPLIHELERAPHHSHRQRPV
jgi:RNA polymerase sigma factor (sigma-70 family)